MDTTSTPPKDSLPSAEIIPFPRPDVDAPPAPSGPEPIDGDDDNGGPTAA